MSDDQYSAIQPAPGKDCLRLYEKAPFSVEVDDDVVRSRRVIDGKIISERSGVRDGSVVRFDALGAITEIN